MSTWFYQKACPPTLSLQLLSVFFNQMLFFSNAVFSLALRPAAPCAPSGRWLAQSKSYHRMCSQTDVAEAFGAEGRGHILILCARIQVDTR